MSRCLTRISLGLVLFVSSEAWAIGLGDINLDSALNEPLRAEIELLSATEEELNSLVVTLASSETFARYGLDRPFYLQEIEFNVVGDADGAIVQARTRNAITEPFLTFLVEATWSSGRLLREYTVLLDPPTYSPPAVQQAPTVEAPRRATPTDSARIERAPQPAPAPQPTYEPPPAYTPPPPPETTPDVAAPAPEAPVSATPEAEAPAPEAPAPSATPAYGTVYSTVVGGDYYVNRGDTLWGIASRLRPDSRLTMNQTMVAIYEANPGAFDGNINRLKAGATLRIPSADNVFQIARADAFDEVKRQNDVWRTDVPTADTGVADTSYEEPAYEEPAYEEPAVYEEPDTAADARQETETTLELVPPDEEQPGVAYDDEFEAAEPLTREQQIENRITELESADVPDQQSLLEIRDAELAALRQELANIRGETYEPVTGTAVADEPPAPDAGTVGQADEPVADVAPAPSETAARTPRRDAPGLLDKLAGWATSTWAMIAYALIVVAGLLFWFVRRGGSDSTPSEWETLDDDEIAAGAMDVASKSTTTLAAPTPDEAIVVIEQDSGIRQAKEEDTVEAPWEPEPVGAAETGQFDSLEDTFSAETGHNLDQTDPLAEADFHMAYGLYDQAADLVNGALEADPGNKAFMSKLCEIYFVWGNRDAFVDAATNLKGAIGGSESAEWNKIVIMGQQIAADHEMFAGADLAAATGAVDLTFEPDADDGAVLDVDFGGTEDIGADIVDLGAADSAADQDFNVGLDVTAEMPAAAEATIETPTIETPRAESPTVETPTIETPTVETPRAETPTVETPTVETRFGDFEGTTELPSLGSAHDDEDPSSDATAEINLDELDLDVSGLAETEFVDLDDTGTHEFGGDLAATGEDVRTDSGDVSVTMQMGSTASNELHAAAENAANTDTDAGAELGSDDATMLAPDYGKEPRVSSDAETMLAPLDDDDDDTEFDFAKTEALPADLFADGTAVQDASDTTLAVAGTDVDLDLDDLTAALELSEIGDAIEKMSHDKTVEQQRPVTYEDTSENETMALSPDDMSDDLHEARTMTEVGTKLDLARAYVDMGDPQGARSILEEVLDEGDDSQRQQAQQLLETLAS